MKTALWVLIAVLGFNAGAIAFTSPARPRALLIEHTVDGTVVFYRAEVGVEPRTAYVLNWWALKTAGSYKAVGENLGDKDMAKKYFRAESCRVRFQ